MEVHHEKHHGKVHHKLITKFKKLHIALKLLIVGFTAFTFLSSAVVVLGMNGVYVANWVMQYDENGNSKWFIPAPTPAPLPEIKDFTAEQVIEKINETRVEEGLSTLTADPLLTQAAITKADDMMQKNYYSYDSPDGTDAWAPIKNAGYNYNWASAQLAHSYTFVTELIDAWLADESIKKDLLDKSKYTDIGVAVKHGNYQGGVTNLIVVYLASKQNTASNYNTGTTASKITCTGPDGKTFIATQKECDDFNAKWGNAPKTTAPKNLPIQSKPSYPNYVTVTCVTVYGTYSSYGKDYNEANMYCNNLKQNALNLQKTVPTVYIPNNTYQPAPTTPPYPTEECNNIKTEWISFKEQFNASMMNNYSSSADAVRALEGYRQQYQNVYSNKGCYGTLSLF